MDSIPNLKPLNSNTASKTTGVSTMNKSGFELQTQGGYKLNIRGYV